MCERDSGPVVLERVTQLTTKPSSRSTSFDRICERWTVGCTPEIVFGFAKIFKFWHRICTMVTYRVTYLYMCYITMYLYLWHFLTYDRHLRNWFQSNSIESLTRLVDSYFKSTILIVLFVAKYSTWIVEILHFERTALVRCLTRLSDLLTRGNSQRAWKIQPRS